MPRPARATWALWALLLPTVALGQRTAHRLGEMPRGCGACHRGHGLPRSQMLAAQEEQVCFRCHGSAAESVIGMRSGVLSSRLRDVSIDFRRPFRHPIERSGIHEPGERLPERSSRAGRHVECVDCHAPHRTVSVEALSGRGFARRSSLDGQTPEYELCYRCHAESPNLPRNASNVRRRFAPANASYHPVEASGRGRDVPSLRPPLHTSSLIACGDCHGNDSGRGIHGSHHAFLLRRAYATTVRTPESPQAYALCYGCHDRSVLFSPASYGGHDRHVRAAQIPCATCHNAHGSPRAAHLIEFAPTVARPAVNPQNTAESKLDYLASGPRQGTCWVSCHGVEHFGVEYCPTNATCNTKGVQPTMPFLKPRRLESPFSF